MEMKRTLLLKQLSEGILPEEIGKSKVSDFPGCLIQFRITYYDENNKEKDEVDADFKYLKTSFNTLRNEVRVVKLFIELVRNDTEQKILDSDLLEAYYEEDED